MNHPKKNVYLLLCLLAVVVLVVCSGYARKESNKLVIYAALNEDEIGKFIDKFKEDTGIEIEYIQGGAGDMAAQEYILKTSLISSCQYSRLSLSQTTGKITVRQVKSHR